MSTEPSPVDEVANRVQALLYRIVGWLLLSLGLAGLLAIALRAVNPAVPWRPVLSGVVMGLSLLAILAGGWLTPRLRRRFI